MKKLASLILLAGTLSIASIADANAWTRDVHTYGWRGTSSLHASGSCGGHSCSRQITRTGPYGNSVSRQGSVSCGGGSCSGSRTTRGPQGGTVTRNATISR